MDARTTQPGVKNFGAEITNNGKTHVKESQIDCGDKTAIFQQKYQIIKSDPQGTDKFTIYLDDQLAYESEFVVK